MATFEDRAKQAEALVDTLRSRVDTLRKIAEDKEIEFLTKENARLVKEVAAAKEELIAAETKKGIKQVALPSAKKSGAAPVIHAIAPSKEKKQPAAAPKAEVKTEAVKVDNSGAKAERKEKAAKKKATGGKVKAAPVAAPVDVTRLNFRVARVNTATNHPESEKLYLEDVDCGETETRQVISGLAGKVPLEEMQNRMVVVLMNLKPVKLRGLISYAMVMCAEQDGKIEIVDPPPGAVPGDVVTFEGYSAPDKLPDPELKPKKKVWEQIAPDLKTNAEGVACYKGVPFMVGDKGACKAKSFTNAVVK